MIKIMIVLTVLVGLLTAHPVPLQAEPLVTVSGIISDDGQLFGSDGVIYEIAENEIGLELVEMIGDRVNVQGKVVAVDDAVMIVVVAFEKVRK